MAPKAMRRPAAAGGRAPRMRPAMMGVRRVSQGEKKFKDEERRSLHRLGTIRIQKAGYYGQEIDVVGEITGFRIDDGEEFADFKISGTQDENFLRVMSGVPDRKASLHLCGDACDKRLTGDLLIHAESYKPVDLAKEAWFTNLVRVPEAEISEADELRRLREAAAKAAEEGRHGEDPEPPKESKEEAKERRKKEKKAKEAEELRKRKAEKFEPGVDDLVRGQKEAAALYSGTGLDPDKTGRNKVMKKARRLGGKSKKKKKKKKKSSSEESGSSSDSTSESSTVDFSTGLFESDRKIQVIFERCPGALAFSAMLEARQNLLTTSGTSWAMERSEIAPIFVQYARQQMGMGLSPAMLQEVVTVASCIDALLQNKPAAAADILCQRLKALEGLSRGNHWSVTRQIELVRTDQHGLAQDVESLAAARRAREEGKLRALVSKPASTPPPPAPDGGYGRGKGGKQNKGSNKGRGDGGRGRGRGDGRKDDQGGWQKKE